MRDKGEVFSTLLHIAAENNIKVQLFPNFRGSYARLHGNRIGIRSQMGIDDINYNLAHELAHVFLHYDKGNTITSDKYKEYEEQADRAAKLLLFAIGVDAVEGGACHV